MELRSRSYLTVATIVLCTTFAQTVVSAADESAAAPTPDARAESETEDVTSPEEALRLEAQAIADQGLMSEEAAVALLAVQPDMEDFIARAADRFGDRVAGAWIETEPRPGVVLRLTGDEPIAQLTEEAEAVAFPVAITYGAALATAEKVAVSESDVVRDWAVKSGIVQGISVGDKADELVFYVTTLLEVPKEVTEFLSSAGMSYSLEITEKMGDANRGGRNMTSCTSGFTYRSVNTNIGYMVYAGHCLDAQSYYWFTGAGPFGIADGYSYWNQNADLFYAQPEPQTAAHFFHASPTDARVPTAEGTAAEGATLCHRGKTSGPEFAIGYVCGTVLDTTYQPTWADACPGGSCNSTFVSVEAYQRGGDSGGPWFNGTRIYGVHKGGVNGGTFSVYSKLVYLPSYLEPMW